MTPVIRVMTLILLLIAAAACVSSRHYENFDDFDDENLDGLWSQTGLASWYGEEFHGRTTANGEVYDMNAYTAAHRTLSFGTIVLVRNLENGREVKVRINDRGPFKKGRVIDLSYAAAKKIDLIRKGITEVRIYALTERN